MNFKKLIGMQKKLDGRIREEKGLQDADLVANTYVALQVELAEFANEARWFKHWSENQEPRTLAWKDDEDCEFCIGKGRELFEENIPCPDCEGLGFRRYNPLLEEYIDSLHFFLSLAIQKGWEEELYIYGEAILDLQAEGFDGGLSGIYLEMIYHLNKSYTENDRNEKIENTLGKTVQEFNFNTAWFLFIAIGLIGFDFSWEQIFQAYIDKNKINHERQVNGY